MTIPSELRSYGLRIPQVPPRRLIVVGEGDTGSGKSDFALRTAPRPLLHINLDHNIEQLEPRYLEDDIVIKDIQMPDVMKVSEKEQKEILEDIYKPLRSLIMTSIEKRIFRTICIDTGDALYELCRLGFLGGLGFGDAPASSFDIVNSNMRRFFRAAKSQRVNLYIPHRRDDEYVDSIGKNGKRQGTRSGKRKIRGWKDASYESQVHVVFEKDLSWSERNNPDEYPLYGRLGKFVMTVVKCTANESVEGKVFRGEEICYPALGTTVFPASEWKEWE